MILMMIMMATQNNWECGTDESLMISLHPIRTREEIQIFAQRKSSPTKKQNLWRQHNKIYIFMPVWCNRQTRGGDKKIRKVSSRRQANETRRTKKFDDKFKQDLTKMNKWMERRSSIQSFWSSQTNWNLENLWGNCEGSFFYSLFKNMSF